MTRVSDRVVRDLLSRIEAALDGHLTDDDLANVVERLQNTADLTPAQVHRLQVAMLKFEGLLMGVRAVRGSAPAPADPLAPPA